MASGTTQEIETLAAEIGDVVYLDIAKWHLYLNDARLHTPLAEQLYPILSDDRLSEEAVGEVLRNFLVNVGGGRHQVALLDLLPSQCQTNLLDLLADYQRKL